MKLKIFFLTIAVGFLGAFSIYFVFQDFKSHKKISPAYLKEKAADYPTAFILPLVEPTYFPLRDWSVLEPDVQAKAAAIFDGRSGKFLFQKNIRTSLPVASITKLLTAAVVIDSIDLDSKIYITSEAVNADNEGGADFFLNESFVARDLFKIMLIKSSNDAAAAFKVFMEKNNINIVSAINQKAKDAGMVNSKFYDPAGLNDQGYSTVEDLIKLLDYVVKYPEIQSVLLTKHTKINSADGKFNHEIENTNKLLGVIPDIEAGKTGYTDAALGAMILKISLPRQGSSLTAVVLGSPDRFEDTRKLVEWAKAAHRWE